MKPPKCRLCQKEHWGVCPANRRREQAQESPAALSEGSEGAASRQKTFNHRPQPEGEDMAKPASVVDAESEVGYAPASLKMDQARNPLTPAEKQRAYRKRIKDDSVRYEKYLEKERARKRG